MDLDDELLEAALAKRDELEMLGDQLERARAEFHRSVQHLYVAGGSLREIAEALGMSHQRVHQIVDQAEPVPAEEVDAPGTHRCSFCGKEQRAVTKLILGPSVGICDRCVTAVRAAATEGRREGELVVSDDPRRRCSFCGKRARQLDWLVEGSRRPVATIGSECLALMEKILRESGSG